MYFGMFYDPTILLLVPAFIFAMLAQGKVKLAYNKYSKVEIRRRITGMEAARRILDAHGLNRIIIQISEGQLSDHYDPRKRVIRLSHDVYHGSSISSVSIAAHEVGHAIQHSVAYKPLTIRNTIAGPVSIMSALSWPLMIIGIIIMQVSYEMVGTGNLIFNIGTIAFVAVLLFHLITLPVEFNASKRAKEELEGMGIIDSEELYGTKKVLSAAAMTYVAALAVALAQLVRILLLRRNN